MAAYVYILRSLAGGTYYIGMTENLSQRLAKHNSGATAFTRARRPWDLIYSEEHSSKSSALARERQIKKRKSRAYIEQLVRAANQIDLEPPPS